MNCPRCGDVLGITHTPDRCADVLAAQRDESHANAVRSRDEMVHWRDRCKTLEAERDAQPRKRIDGCQHTRRRMNEWIDESACPICLTATLGVRNNKVDALTRRVVELEETIRRIRPVVEDRGWVAGVLDTALAASQAPRKENSNESE
jgi:hypothetical protein